MKLRTRVWSLLLVLTMLFSVCAVFATAEESGSASVAESTGGTTGGSTANPEESKDPEADWDVFYNRTYDEPEIGIFDGASAVKKTNKILTLTERVEDPSSISGFRENNYLMLQMAEAPKADGKFDDVYFEPLFNTNQTKFVFEVSVRLPDEAVGPAASFYMEFKYNDASGSRTGKGFMTCSTTGALALTDGTVLGQLSSTEWTDLDFLLDMSDWSVDAYVNGKLVKENAYFGTSSDVYGTLLCMRFYVGSGNVANAGICMDNYRVYAGTHVRDLGDDVGSTSGGNNSGATVSRDDIKDSLFLHIGTPDVLQNTVKMPIDDKGTTPVKVGDIVYVPAITVGRYADAVMAAISEKSFTILGGEKESDESRYSAIITIGSPSAYVNERAVSLPDGERSVINYNNVLMISIASIDALFPGKYVTYDEQMKLIIVDDQKDVLTRAKGDLQTMVLMMEQFIFEDVTGEEIMKDMEENCGMTHPRIFLTPDRVSELKKVYDTKRAELPESELVLKDWMSKYMQSANSMLSATYQPPAYGYDGGDRMGRTTSYLGQWGFAYLMTGDMRYAEKALTFFYPFSQYDDWCPGHSLNCADMSQWIAIAYDWMFDAWNDTEHWTAELVGDLIGEAEAAKIPKNIDGTVKIRELWEDTLYYYAVASAIGSFNGTSNQQNSHGTFGRSTWTRTENNWNAVCNAGYLMCAVALADVETKLADNMIPLSVNTHFSENPAHQKEGTSINTPGAPLPSLTSSTAFSTKDATGATTYREEITWLLGNIMQSIRIGVRCYAPDGGYAESSGYWSYGTNNLFRFCMTLLSSTGTDYSIMSAAGCDVTGYFPLYIESSDNVGWGYHDGSNGAIDSSLLAWVANFFDDKALYTLRYNQIAEGRKGYSLYDMIYYDADMLSADASLALDFIYYGIDTAVFRSSWEKGAIYTGLHGGYNSVNHGDMDAGNFIYDAEGIRWITELGSDNYNLSGYFGGGANGGKWKYYRKTSEGQNVIVITTQNPDTGAEKIKFGQDPTATAPTDAFHSEENGGYAIMNMAAAYGDGCALAQRGLLFTNSRTTMVIQDEIQFTESSSLWWFAHLAKNTTVTIASSGRIAYIEATDKEGETHTLRARIVSDISRLKFTLMDLVPVLAATSGAPEGALQQEYSREGMKKLAINAKNVINFNLAVVFEMIENKNEVIGYEKFTSMRFWEISDDQWIQDANANLNPTPDPDDTPNPDAPSVDPNKKFTAFDLIDPMRSLDPKKSLLEQYQVLATARYIEQRLDEKQLAQVYSFKDAYKVYSDFVNAYNTIYDIVSDDFASFEQVFDGMQNAVNNPAKDAINAAE